MDRATFFKHFDLLADQPEGVAKMRELVLELAVRGQLVSQSTKDEPASELLKRTEAERARAVTFGEIRKQEPLPSVEDDAPYQIPTGWLWTRLGNTGRIFNGNSVSESGKAELAKVEKGLPFIATKDVGYGREALIYENGLRVPPNDPDFKVAHSNAVLICAEGGSAGRKIGITDRDICFGNKLYANEVWAGIHHRYIFYVYQSPAFFKQFASRMTGIIGGIARSEFHLLPVPIPPENEQRRIVAKVDELMALCDELEQRQQARQHARGQLQESALHHLLVAREPVTFAGAWQRTRDHFHLLHATPDAIPQLRQAILQLAVQGRLTEQKDTDGNADDLLQMIAKHKEKLVKAKELKARQAVEPVEISPSILPENWAWCRLAEICLNITDGFHNTPKTAASGVRYITAQHIRPNVIDFENCFFVSEGDHQELVSKTKPKKGDILVVNIGAGSGTAAIIDVDFEFSFKNVAILNKHDAIDSAYLYYVLIESRAATFDELTKGGAQPFLSLGVLRNILVPLPPLAEQKRIVARVEELMRWCDTLEAQLQQTRILGANLLDSTIYYFLAGNQASPASAIHSERSNG